MTSLVPAGAPFPQAPEREAGPGRSSGGASSTRMRGASTRAAPRPRGRQHGRGSLTKRVVNGLLMCLNGFHCFLMVSTGFLNVKKCGLICFF